MNENLKKKNRLTAERVIKGLESRQMKGYFAETKEDALKLALSLIPEGSSITNGGCMSMNEIGLTEAVSNGKYNYLDRNGAATPEEKKAMEVKGFSADFFIASANAITEDGILINIDGYANRVAAIAYGPSNVIIIAGMNKVSTDFDSAMKRARNVAAVENAIRLDKKTPCTKTGSCMNCKSPDTICCQFLITRFSMIKDRIKVILVNEDLGF